MADKKISQLLNATVPLTGTETLPIVQNQTTVKVEISDLTSGRDVTAKKLILLKDASVSNTWVVFDDSRSGYGDWSFYKSQPNGLVLGFDTTGGSNPTGCIIFEYGGDVKFNVGNLNQGTAAKGINFIANTPASGMTSRLLNWYEEGTWAPTQGGGLTVIGNFSSTGKYTRIGRQVTISGTVTGATSIAVSAAGIITTNLPFTVVTEGHGSATNATNTTFTSVICTATNVNSAGSISATQTITFSATYFV